MSSAFCFLFFNHTIWNQQAPQEIISLPRKNGKVSNLKKNGQVRYLYCLVHIGERKKKKTKYKHHGVSLFLSLRIFNTRKREEEEKNKKRDNAAIFSCVCRRACGRWSKSLSCFFFFFFFFGRLGGNTQLIVHWVKKRKEKR